MKEWGRASDWESNRIALISDSHERSASAHRPATDRKETERVEEKCNETIFCFQLNSWPGVITDFIVRSRMFHMQPKCNETKYLHRISVHFSVFIKHASMHSHSDRAAIEKTKARDKTRSQWMLNAYVCDIMLRWCRSTLAARRLSAFHSNFEQLTRDCELHKIMPKSDGKSWDFLCDSHLVCCLNLSLTHTDIPYRSPTNFEFEI